MTSFGSRLKHYRTKKNFSINEVAKLLEVSASTYRAWELGTKIQGELLYPKLAKIFSITLSELLTGEENKIDDYLKEIELLIQKIRTQG